MFFEMSVFRRVDQPQGVKRPTKIPAGPLFLHRSDDRTAEVAGRGGCGGIRQQDH
jgi:hypothetical protein